MLVGLQIGSLISPAYACGCGAMVVDDAMRVSVDQEVSAVRWDGRTEQIAMQLTVDGNAAEAAWIMPVPDRATVELGDSSLFDALGGEIRPEQRARHHFWPDSDDWPLDWLTGHADDAGAAPQDPGSVGVVGRGRLGPFDLARLTATDPDALRDWLADNGFELPEALASELEPYVDAEWEYVAVRLAPEENGEVLTGNLDPLLLSFASDELVYPMRLSRLAKTPQSLGLYVLADHRMEPRSAIGGREPELLYAGKVVPKDAVRDFAGSGDLFLTAYRQEFPEPDRINGDHELRRAEADTPYQRVTYYEGGVTRVGGVPAWILTVAGFLALVAPAVLFRVRRARSTPRR
ncbi:DUF2330 domain-containing protein [Streptomyces sp. NPDC006365]|uniref:DUF2330 domain-containing protein n=1 Tax=Streptomyces sp. NPDC006365 TaxID=3364744 RepID=UPI0036B9591B